MELYTTLTALKQSIGGELPPMTPLPPEALEFIDPTQVLGLGGLIERPIKGLKCPVRGCDAWNHGLERHLNEVHADIGGANAVRQWLDIPRPTRLASQRYRSTQRKRAEARAPELRAHLAKVRKRLGPGQAQAAASTLGAMAKRSTVARNARDLCEAQLAAKILRIQTANNGAPVTRKQAEMALTAATVVYIIRVYGSWNAFKARIGARLAIGKSDRGAQACRAVFESLSAWFAEHGRMPTDEDFERDDVMPVLPTVDEVLAAARTTSLPAALDAIAWSEGLKVAA